MTIASEITRINNNIASAYTACNGKGATMPATQNSANLADCIDSIQSGGGEGIPREVVNGVYRIPASSFTFSLPSGATDLGERALYNAFSNCSTIVSADLSSLTTISGNYAMSGSFQYCINLASVNLSNLITISSRSDALYVAFRGCSALTNVDLSSLTTIANNASYALQNAFANTALVTLSFPSITYIDRSSQLTDMLSGVTGCTVHFPSNLQSVIGSWSSVTAGFGGTNTTVLFDLPATA